MVVAVGAQVNTFNTPGVKENCHFLKVSVENISDIFQSFPWNVSTNSFIQRFLNLMSLISGSNIVITNSYMYLLFTTASLFVVYRLKII